MPHGDGNLESQDHTEVVTESLRPKLSSEHLLLPPAPTPYLMDELQLLQLPLVLQDEAVPTGPPAS